MGRALLWVLAIVLVILVGFSIYAATVDPEVTPQRVEKVVPNETLGL